MEAERLLTPVPSRRSSATTLPRNFGANRSSSARPWLRFSDDASNNNNVERGMVDQLLEVINRPSPDQDRRRRRWFRMHVFNALKSVSIMYLFVLVLPICSDKFPAVQIVILFCVKWISTRRIPPGLDMFNRRNPFNDSSALYVSTAAPFM